MATTTAAGMAKRVFVSALVGVVAGAVLILPVVSEFGHIVLFRHIGFWLAGVPWLVLLGLAIASPLIAIAVAIGVLCRKSIDRHPVLWSSMAPVSVWLFTCAVFAGPESSQTWAPHRDFLQRLQGEVKGVDNSLFFFAPAAAALCFAILTRRAGAPRSTGRP